MSEDSNENFETSNSTVKQNLKTWLNKHRMINDTIDILDAKIVNIQINYTIVADLEANKYEILNTANLTLADHYKQKLEIGESFYITDIYSVLNRINGVVDTTQVSVTQVMGGLYSTTTFDMDAAMSPDGRFIRVPNNVVLELKYPEDDIRGSVL